MAQILRQARSLLGVGIRSPLGVRGCCCVDSCPCNLGNGVTVVMSGHAGSCSAFAYDCSKYNGTHDLDQVRITGDVTQYYKIVHTDGGKNYYLIFTNYICQDGRYYIFTFVGTSLVAGLTCWQSRTDVYNPCETPVGKTYNKFGSPDCISAGAAQCTGLL